MKLEINSDKLIDAPYSDQFEQLIVNNKENIDDFVSDILLGTPTCYLVSGYRGSGKSSFINKVESRADSKKNELKAQLEEKRESRGKKIHETVFIKMNFSRYQNQGDLLRKLIRALYLKLGSNDNYKNLLNRSVGQSNIQDTALLLQRLYDKTFYEVTQSKNTQNKTENVLTQNIDIIALVSSGLVFTFLLLNLFTHWLNASASINIIGFIGSFSIGVKEIMKISSKNTFSNTRQENEDRKSLYDNEIADHYFNQIVKIFHEYGFNLIFVLDELDKVDDNHIEKLLNELKPFFVSGMASFIVVSGQNLFYKYIESKSKDDAVLSSLFSKTIHIDLLKREEFYDLFNKLLVQQPTDDIKNTIKPFIDKLIFESKRVPRKFIGSVRHNLVYERGKAYIEINESPSEYKLYKLIIDIIEKVSEEIKIEDFDRVTRDYIINQLFIKSHIILSKKNLAITKDEILNHHG